MSGPYVPIEDLANHFSVSVSTIRGWLKRNQIPNHTFIRVGNTYRFSIEDVSVALSAPKPASPSLIESYVKDEYDEAMQQGGSDDVDNDGPLEVPHDYDEDEDL